VHLKKGRALHLTMIKRLTFCIALPIRVNGEGKTEQMSAEVSGLVKELGYRTIESHKVFVHRTLTREIMVYEKA
jgi:tRNA G10  N-methylase Trm11